MVSTEQSHPEAVTLRERKKQHTRRALHDAARQLIERQGLDGTTIEQICAAVDVSPRTFFNYFPSKAAAALNLPDTAISAETIARFRSAEGDVVPALCELIGASADHSIDRAQMKALITQRPELFPAFTQWMGAVREQFIQLAQERTSSSDVAAAAVALVMTGFGLLVHDASISDAPATVRLLAAVDKIVAVRDAPLVASQAPEE
jgi:AcrR family transcriptional regulator